MYIPKGWLSNSAVDPAQPVPAAVDTRLILPLREHLHNLMTIANRTVEDMINANEEAIATSADIHDDFTRHCFEGPLSDITIVAMIEKYVTCVGNKETNRKC